MFPMQIHKLSLRHRGGTKDYHLVSIISEAGNGLLINRWGKAGSWGSLKIEQFGSKAATDRAFEHLFESKEGRGYTEQLARNRQTAHNEGELSKYLGPQYMAQIGAANLLHINDKADTSGIREPEEVSFNKRPNGSFALNEKPRKLVKDVEPTVEDLKANPNWGIF